MYKTIKEWCDDCGHYQEPLLVKKLRENGFDDDQILKILDVYDTTCQHCHDSDSDCQCWNDE